MVEQAKGPPVGLGHEFIILRSRFADGWTVYQAFERAYSGRYTLDVDVDGTSRTAAMDLAAVLIRRLQGRLKLALAGRLHAKPVLSRGLRKAGPPARGPAPASLALKLPASGKVIRHAGYQQTSFVSSYREAMATDSAYLYEEVDLAANSLAASYWAATFLWNDTHPATYRLARFPAPVRSIRLRGVSDHAIGQLIRVRNRRGSLVSYAHIVLRRGRWLEYLIAVRSSPIGTAELRAIARSAADRLDNGLKR